MPWLFIATTAYFFLAVASLGDRFFLAGALSNPRTYAFYIGFVIIFILPFLLPFDLVVPDFYTLFLGLGAGVVWTVALLAYFEAISRSEVSRVVPANGAFVPIFTFIFTLFVSSQTMSSYELLAFALLILGGVLISSKKIPASHLFEDSSLIFILAGALFFALGFILLKAAFLRTSFATAYSLSILGRAAASLPLLYFKDVRDAVFHKKIGFKKQILIPFAIFQSAGGIGSTLQMFSVDLAKISQVPLVNALEGTRYLFLFLFVWLAAKWRPTLLKEEMQGSALLQKILAGIIIIFGTAILAIAT